MLREPYIQALETGFLDASCKLLIARAFDSRAGTCCFWRWLLVLMRLLLGMPVEGGLDALLEHSPHGCITILNRLQYSCIVWVPVALHASLNASQCCSLSQLVPCFHADLAIERACSTCTCTFSGQAAASIVPQCHPPLCQDVKESACI